MRSPGLLLTLLALGTPLHAQELEPRAFSPNPTGLTFLVAAAGLSTGEVVFDPTVPITDVDATLYSIGAGVGQTFALLGRTASAALTVPYAWGSMKGLVGEARDSIERSGLADARVRLSINLVGVPALPLAEFVKRTPRPSLGFGLTTSIPTGEYMDDKLINLGTNRWAFKPELGFVYPAGRWTLEAYAGCWFFTTNSSFFGGQVRSQKPLASLQGHVSYTVRRGLWIAADATFYSGGRTTVDGVESPVRQENSRVGVTVSVPVGSSNSIKATVATGATTRIGGNFQSLGVAWQKTLF